MASSFNQLYAMFFLKDMQTPMLLIRIRIELELELPKIETCSNCKVDDGGKEHGKWQQSLF